MYELTDDQAKVVAGGLSPPVNENGPTTRYHTKNGTLYAVTTYPQLTKDKVEATAVGDAVGDLLSGGGSTFWNLVGGAADDVGAESSPVTGTVSVGPLTPVPSGGGAGGKKAEAE